MKCEEFRDRHQDLLNERFDGPLPADLQEHVSTCGSCARYLREMMVVEDGLRNLENIPISPELMKKLLEIPKRFKPPAFEASWWPDIRRPIIALGITVAWTTIGLLLPFDMQFAFLGVLMVAMTLYMGSDIVWKMIFNELGPW